MCADFRLHQLAHQTHFDSVQLTHPHTSFCDRTRTCNHIFFTFFFLNFIGFKDFIVKKWRCGHAAHVRARPHTSTPKNCRTCTCAGVRARTHTKGLPICPNIIAVWPLNTFLKYSNNLQIHKNGKSNLFLKNLFSFVSV